MARIKYKKKYPKCFKFYPELHIKLKNISKEYRITQNELVEMGIDLIINYLEVYGKKETKKQIKTIRTDNHN